MFQSSAIKKNAVPANALQKAGNGCVAKCRPRSRRHVIVTLSTTGTIKHLVSRHWSRGARAMAIIHAVGTAVPPYLMTQSAAKSIACEHFSGKIEGLQKYLRI